MFWCSYWQFRLSRFQNKVFNFYEGDIVVVYPKIINLGSALNRQYLFRTVL